MGTAINFGEKSAIMKKTDTIANKLDATLAQLKEKMISQPGSSSWASFAKDFLIVVLQCVLSSLLVATVAVRLYRMGIWANADGEHQQNLDEPRRLVVQGSPVEHGEPGAVRRHGREQRFEQRVGASREAHAPAARIHGPRIRLPQAI